MFQNNGGRLIVVSYSITVQDAVNEIQTLKQQLNIWRVKLSNISKVIDQISSYMRQIIRNDNIPTSWSYQPHG